MRLGEAPEALGEDAARAIRPRAHEASDGDLNSDGSPETWQVGQPAVVPAVDAGLGATDGTGCGRDGEAQFDGQGIGVDQTVIEVTPRRTCEEFERK
jgi:hypothetical protein